jgi:oligopeptidase B
VLHGCVASGLHDARVSYWEPAKWVAKTRVQATNAPLILLRTNLGAGHFGVTGVYSALRETALKYAFLLRITCAVTEAEGLSGKAAGVDSGAAAVCVPCIMVFIAVVAGFAGLVAASLYYGGGMLQSLWTFGDRRGIGLREIAMQGFGVHKRNGRGGDRAAEQGGAAGAGAVRTDRDRERERLIGDRA